MTGKGPDEMMKSAKMMKLTEKLMSDPAILSMMSDPNQVYIYAHTSAYVSISQQTSADVSIRQHT